MKETLTALNRLPERTWNWLSINETSLDVPSGLNDYAKNSLSVPANIPEGVTFRNSTDFPIHKTSSLFESSIAYVNEHKNSEHFLQISQGVKLTEPLFLNYHLSANEHLSNRLHVCSQKNSKGTIIICYTGEAGATGLHSGFLDIDVEPESELSIQQIQLLPETMTHLDTISVQVYEKGLLTLLLAELGAKDAVAGCDITLAGSQAKTELSSFYLGSEGSVRDMNYRITFAQPETQGLMNVRGTLNGNAHKTLKSTIDFLRGARGSQGREEEAVLVLSDKVVNTSSPLLLCGEDDVQGEHATSIGKPNAEKLYYLMTRGFTQKEALVLLTEASFAPLLDALPEGELREMALTQLRKVTEL